MPLLPSPRSSIHGPAVALALSLNIVIIVIIALAASTGCTNRNDGGGYNTADMAPLPTAPDDDGYTWVEPGTAIGDQLERRYVIGPTTADTFGYRVDWQLPAVGAGIKNVTPAADSVFTLSDRNVLSRLDRESGDRIWRIPVASPLERILGITFVPSAERIYLTTGGGLLELDSASGSHIDTQPFAKAASTAGVPVGPFIVYGTRNGQLQWHAFQLGTEWRAYQVAASISVPPVYSDGYLVAVGADGRVMSLIADAAAQVWTARTLAPIVATPAAGDGVAYVAGMDQHLRAYDLRVPRAPLWEYLTESALTESPVLIGSSVYQQVPSEGLVCLEAQPQDRPGGVVRWRAPDVTGTVLTRTNDGILVWDRDGRRLQLVEERRGGLIETFETPAIDDIVAAGVDGGELYAIGVDGRVTRLTPRF